MNGAAVCFGRDTSVSTGTCWCGAPPCGWAGSDIRTSPQVREGFLEFVMFVLGHCSTNPATLADLQSWLLSFLCLSNRSVSVYSSFSDSLDHRRMKNLWNWWSVSFRRESEGKPLKINAGLNKRGSVHALKFTSFLHVYSCVRAWNRSVCLHMLVTVHLSHCICR